MSPSRWEEVAEDYNRIFRNDTYYQEILSMIADRAQGEGNPLILDVGCGTGNLIAVLRERFTGAVILGVDPAPKMVELCADRFADDPGVKIEEGEGTKLPFPAEYFDCIASNLALHHVLPDMRSACAGELARVLKGGGRLVYSDLFWDTPGEREDPARCREIIEKLVAYALYSLETGAYEMTLFLLEQLPLHLDEVAEYVTVLEDWLEPLADAGFGDLEVIVPPHPEFAFRIITGVKPAL